MTFPKDFVWGAATSSFQIEGSTSGVDGCGESVWDMLCRRKDGIKGGHTAIVASDHYNRYREDVALMKEIGLKAYRMSIMWPRVMPDGVGKINEKGMAFYDRLIDELLAAGVDPWVTLFHWDYPLPLFYRGGWLNEDSSDWFAEYTAAVIDRLSDRVTNWITQNEPVCFISENRIFVPGLKYSVKEANRAWHNALLAHGKAVQVIRAGAKVAPKVGAAPVCMNYFPATESKEDIDAARRKNFSYTLNSENSTMEWWNDSNTTSLNRITWWMDPVFKGEYPEDGMRLYGTDAPVIKNGDMELISQPLDFIGWNCYDSNKVRVNEQGEDEVVELPVHYPKSPIGMPIVPESLYWCSRFLTERYGDFPIYITENGMAMRDVVGVDGRVADGARIDFITRYLRGVRRAIDEGYDVKGYFVWSLMDNFEWASGYEPRFGLVHVDYETQKRTIKDSGYWYGKVIESDGEIIGAGLATENWPDFSNPQTTTCARVFPE